MDQDNKDGLTYGCLPWILAIVGIGLIPTPAFVLGILFIIGAVCLAAKKQ